MIIIAVILGINVLMTLACLYRMSEDRKHIVQLYQSLTFQVDIIKKHEKYISRLQIETMLLDLDDQLLDAEENDEYEVCRELRLKIYKLEEQLKEI
jgi:hypothetical protein